MRQSWSAGWRIPTDNTSAERYTSNTATRSIPLVIGNFDPAIELTQKTDGWYIDMKLDPAWADQQARKIVTTELLGLVSVPGLPYEQQDGKTYRLDRDWFGTVRDAGKPFPGPFGPDAFRNGPRAIGAGAIKGSGQKER